MLHCILSFLLCFIAAFVMNKTLIKITLSAKTNTTCNYDGICWQIHSCDALRCVAVSKTRALIWSWYAETASSFSGLIFTIGHPFSIEELERHLTSSLSLKVGGLAVRPATLRLAPDWQVLASWRQVLVIVVGGDHPSRRYPHLSDQVTLQYPSRNAADWCWQCSCHHIHTRTSHCLLGAYARQTYCTPTRTWSRHVTCKRCNTSALEIHQHFFHTRYALEVFTRLLSWQCVAPPTNYVCSEWT